MALPTTTKQFFLPKLGSYDYLTLSQGAVRPPKATEALIKVHAVSLQYRDLIMAKGLYPLGKRHRFLHFVDQCSDLAGEIVAVGEDVTAFKAGDRVCSNFSIKHLDGDPSPETMATSLGGTIHGVLTQYITLPAEALVSIPEHLSYEEASTLPCAALTAYNALLGPVPVKAGDFVLVQGTGGVSIFGLQFAVASGATVIATSSSDEKLKLAGELGAKHLINYKKNPEWQKEVKKITGGRGVDHVIEVGGPGTLPKSIQSIRLAGWIHVIGFVAGGQDSSLVGPIVGTAANLRGILIGSVRQFKDMNRLIATHNLRPVVNKVFPFEQTAEAYKYLESQAHVGKVVIKVS
ncbi:NAD-P-binding protein [Pleurotus eryngii]|uniref:NAD-P-binding protein n=1 Tax=Pleurotus eryngii TaxID=5323 RepID=A0A9P6A161_PLEER|nr:NAD-P-binding protein [Pleurotus eryngii]